MTQILQRAQTTAERVRDMAVSQIAAEIDALTAQRDALTADRFVANRQSDALRAERDEARAEVERLRPAAEATETTAERINRRVRAACDPYGDGDIQDVCDQIAAEIDNLTEQLAEARAKLKECDDNTDFVQGLREAEQATLANTQRLLGVAHTELAEARADLAKCGADLQYEFDNPGDSRRRIAELEAEVERLRPAAEAWEAYDDYMMCPESDEAAKFPVWVAAHKAAKSAQVARAAKESQP